MDNYEDKEALRRELEAKTQEFLARGGKIYQAHKDESGIDQEAMRRNLRKVADWESLEKSPNRGDYNK